VHARAHRVRQVAPGEDEVGRDDRRGSLSVRQDERLCDEWFACSLGEAAPRGPAADDEPERRCDVDPRDAGREGQ